MLHTMHIPSSAILALLILTHAADEYHAHHLGLFSCLRGLALVRCCLGDVAMLMGYHLHRLYAQSRMYMTIPQHQ